MDKLWTYWKFLSGHQKRTSNLSALRLEFCEFFWKTFVQNNAGIKYNFSPHNTTTFFSLLRVISPPLKPTTSFACLVEGNCERTWVMRSFRKHTSQCFAEKNRFVLNYPKYPRISFRAIWFIIVSSPIKWWHTLTNLWVQIWSVLWGNLRQNSIE